MANAWSIAGEIKRGLWASRQPEKAEGMRAYLKSALPCLGVHSKDRRASVAAALSTHQPDRLTWGMIIDALWDEPEYREERQAAIDVLCAPPAEAYRDADTLERCERMIVEGRWWDLVDATAWAVNDILDRHRRRATPIVRGWIDADDKWLRRTAIISQLRSRQATDLELLTDAIEANTGSEEFFLRKAIGWALRSYAKTDPDWVRSFVEDHREEMSGLSIREATKHL